MNLSLLTLAIAHLLAFTSPVFAQPSSFEAECRALQERKFDAPAAKLSAIFEFQWNHLMETYPEWATYQGEDKGQDRFTDMSLQAIEKRKRELNCPLALIKSVDPKTLTSEEDRLNHSLFLRDALLRQERQRFPSELLAVSQLGGVHQDLPQLLLAMKKVSVRDYENILTRLQRSPALIQQNMRLLEEGLRQGITPPRATLRSVPRQFDPLLSTDLEKNPLYAAFKEMPDSIPSEERERIRTQAKSLIIESVIPELKRLQAFLLKSYIPGARESIQATSLPDGPAWYAHQVKSHTTTSLTPEEIHELGLRETERIRREMDKVMRESGWKKDRASFFHFLRTDPRFFFRKKEDLLASYRDIAKRADPELPRLFGRLPRMTYGVKAVPDYAEKSAPTGFYEGGSAKAGRPAWFIANTYDLKSRPRWEMEALTLHEAVPGHHLQIALAQEMENVPEFRRESFYTAYIEGWGLYAESLGSEMGFFKDPYSKIGSLTYEMWRANRLVVDTGIHAFGWSREKAIEFMKSNMPKPLHDIEVEVDRYIVNPGQALAYKIGQLKFLELREKARAALGDAFDVRDYHDTALASGALPLNVLEEKIDRWIENKKNSSKGKTARAE